MELLHEDGSPWCSLPDLPFGRDYHSQTGLEVCGGNDANNTFKACLRFGGGSWNPSHNLQEGRNLHSSWASPSGTVLLGGSGSPETTELLDDTTGNSVMHFPLKYHTT